MNPTNFTKYLGLFVSIALTSAAATLITSCATPQHAGGAVALHQRTLLDADWFFHRGDVDDSNAVIAANFDDHQWQPIHLPHDYILDGAYDPTNARNHGYLAFMPAWYRKHLTIPALDQGKLLRLDFDGVFRNSEVWLNGTYLGKYLSGYTPFSYDITKVAKPGAENVITVRVGQERILKAGGTKAEEFTGMFI